mgnify:CR=1 FL=1
MELIFLIVIVIILFVCLAVRWSYLRDEGYEGFLFSRMFLDDIPIWLTNRVNERNQGSIICTLPLLTSPPPFSAFTFSFLDYFYYLCRDYEAKKHSKDKQGTTNDNKREETSSAVARIAFIVHSNIPVGGMVLR